MDRSKGCSEGGARREDHCFELKRSKDRVSDGTFRVMEEKEGEQRSFDEISRIEEVLRDGSDGAEMARPR